MRYNTLGVQVTNVCNMTCDHCITDSSPAARGDLDWDRIDAAVRSAASQVDGICVTGGEPLLRRDLTMRIIRLTRELGLVSSMVTNGYWARTRESAKRVFSELEQAGLHKLAVSFDRFHDRLVSGASLETLVAVGSRTNIEVQIQYCGDQQDEAYRTADELATRYGVNLISAEVLPFGRGRELAAKQEIDMCAVPDDPCGVVVRPVLTPEGDLFTCCGPARDSSSTSPLRLAENADSDVGSALSEGEADPILNLIHSKGPRTLLKYLAPATQERVSTGLLDDSICSLCRAITDDSKAVSELHAALSGDRFRLIALSAVMQDAQTSEREV